MLGVARRTLILWIENGHLKAYKTPGGHRRITRNDLLTFLQNQSMPVPSELFPESERVLIIEENEQILQDTALLLKQHPNAPYQVQVARNGYEGLLKTGLVNPSIILLNLSMSMLDGMEVLRHIRKQDALGHIIIIATTQVQEESYIEQAYIEGAQAVLPTPVTLEEFDKTIERFRLPN